MIACRCSFPMGSNEMHQRLTASGSAHHFAVDMHARLASRLSLIDRGDAVAATKDAAKRDC